MKKFTIVVSISFLATLLIIIAAGKKSDTSLKPSYNPSENFNNYWYNNEAEITHFDLKQARYGEIHEGDAVMIFVSEHLSPNSYIKSYNKDGKDIPVLKLNMTRKFITGIYPYSVMNSVFTPVNLSENPSTVRNTFSSQEWCGHVFSKVDLNNNVYTTSVNSYFPDEGDFTSEIPLALMEDEIWNRIRIDHESLPTGPLSIIPSLQHIRFLHLETKPRIAFASKVKEGKYFKYTIEYEQIRRSLIIWFENEHPYRISKWTEEYISGFGADARFLKTEATATHTKNLDYWNKNKKADQFLREELGY